MGVSPIKRKFKMSPRDGDSAATTAPAASASSSSSSAAVEKHFPLRHSSKDEDDDDDDRKDDVRRRDDVNKTEGGITLLAKDEPSQIGPTAGKDHADDLGAHDGQIRAPSLSNGVAQCSNADDQRMEVDDLDDDDDEEGKQRLWNAIVDMATWLLTRIRNFVKALGHN